MPLLYLPVTTPTLLEGCRIVEPPNKRVDDYLRTSSVQYHHIMAQVP
jgi:hypothetical protein